MHKEGHLIGIHNYIHKTNWLMRPRTVRDQIDRTGQIIQEITGENLFLSSAMGHYEPV